VVVDFQGRPTGILTERDILRKVVSTCRDAMNVKVKEATSKP